MKMAANRAQTKDVDAPLQGALETLPKCAALLRVWADKLDKRHEHFASLESDLGDLFSHTEQLSLELEKSRPNAPVYKNAEDALKKAVNRTAKVLKDMQSSLDAIRAELAPPSQYDTVFDNAEKCLSECYEYAETYREGCKNFEAAGEILPTEKKEKKSKKAEKERKRSNSPKRSREKTSALMA
jgi:hypothetical protein